MLRIQAPPVSVRDAVPGDAEDVARMLRLLSPYSSFMRFFVGFGEPKPELVRALIATGPQRGALLAVLPSGSVVGHACWSVAEAVIDLGVVVLDGWQRQGIGHSLVRAVVGRAQTVGGTQLHLDVHPENAAVLASLRSHLPTARRRFADGLVMVDVALPDVPACPGRPDRSGADSKASLLPR